RRTPENPSNEFHYSFMHEQMNDDPPHLWQRGVSLTDAAWHFAPSILKRRHAAARRGKTAVRRQPNSNPSSIDEAIKGIAVQIQSFAEHLRSQSEAWGNIEDALF